jgi:L-lactate dehydrogenase complex protein LldG
MSARDNILARIRAQQGKPEVPTADELAVVGAYIAAHAQSARPRIDGNLRALFCERALGLSSTLAVAAALGAVPQAIADYLRSHSLPSTAVCWPEFAALDWRAAGVDVERRAARDGDAVGITGAFCAIAETGTLLLLSGDDTPATASLLPETHIAVVRAARIVSGMEEAWALLRAERGAPPRAATFVSGPSRTADIEQTVTLGAHGPYRLHIILVSE